MATKNTKRPSVKKPIALALQGVPRVELMSKALSVANVLARGSQTAIKATKMSLNNWMRLAGPIFDNSLALEMLGFLGADAREGRCCGAGKAEILSSSNRGVRLTVHVKK